MKMRVVAAVLFALLAPGAAAQQTMYPPPPGAMQVKHEVLQAGSVEQDQFWLKETYPASSAAEYYNRILQDMHPCTAKKNDWSTFGDISRGKEQRVHRLDRYWVNAANDTSVTLVLRYVSSGIKPRPAPDNDRQYVSVTRYKGKRAANEFTEMGLTCQRK